MTELLCLSYSKNCKTRVNVLHIMSLGNFTLNQIRCHPIILSQFFLMNICQCVCLVSIPWLLWGPMEPPPLHCTLSSSPIWFSAPVLTCSQTLVPHPSLIVLTKYSSNPRHTIALNPPKSFILLRSKTTGGFFPSSINEV